MTPPEKTRKQTIEQELVTIAGRLDLLIETLGLNPTAFSSALGQSSITSIIKNGKGFRVTLLIKIGIVFPEVNLDWIITGRGLMMHPTQEQAIDPQALINHNMDLEKQLKACKNAVQKLDVSKDLLMEERDRYKDKLAILKELGFEELANYRLLLSKQENSKA